MGYDYDSFLFRELPDPDGLGYVHTDVGDGTVIVTRTGETTPYVLLGPGFAVYVPEDALQFVSVKAQASLYNGNLKAGDITVQCVACGDWVPSADTSRINGKAYCTINKCNQEVRR